LNQHASGLASVVRRSNVLRATRVHRCIPAAIGNARPAKGIPAEMFALNTSWRDRRQPVWSAAVMAQTVEPGWSRSMAGSVDVRAPMPRFQSARHE